MKTIGDILQLSRAYLQERGVANARRQCEELLCDALGIARVTLYTDHDRPLLPRELDICRSRLVRRARGEPAAYIHGQVSFADLTLHVSPDVLIPRQETEILVENIAKELTGHRVEQATLWDVCTGSGCIGIALAKKCPWLHVELSDISPAALQTAQRNAQANGVSVTLHEGDLLHPFRGRKCRYLVCNPPYVSETDYPQLPLEVRQHEPRLALVAAENGYAFYRRLAAELPHHLESGAQVWLELGTGMGPSLLDLFSGPEWKQRHVEKDWSGHDRFFVLEFE